MQIKYHVADHMMTRVQIYLPSLIGPPLTMCGLCFSEVETEHISLHESAPWPPSLYNSVEHHVLAMFMEHSSFIGQ